jgi:hypothetical protein
MQNNSINKEEETPLFSYDLGYKAQTEFCYDKDIPHFAPYLGWCSCGRNIYSKISVQEAGRDLITGCPHCNKSFVE